MLHQVSIRLADYLIVNNVAKEEKKAYYVYGLELFLGKLISYSSMLLLAIFFDQTIPIILFFVFLLSLRKYTGGYHLKSFLACYLSTLGLSTFNIVILTPFLFENRQILYPCLLVAVIVILLLKPVNHPNLNLSNSELKGNNRKAKIVLIIEIIFIIVANYYFINPAYYVLPSIGIIQCAVLMVMAKISHQEV